MLISFVPVSKIRVSMSLFASGLFSFLKISISPVNTEEATSQELLARVGILIKF